VPERDTSDRLVAVEDVLRLLDEAGPLRGDALARALELHRLEARMVLLHAHWHGLVHAGRGGEWAISERGRRALAGELTRPGLVAYLSGLRASASALLWRRRLRPGYIARGGVSLGLATVVAVAGVAVASSSLPITGPPTVPAVHAKHSRRHRHRHGRLAAHTLLTSTVVIASRRIERSRPVVTVIPAQSIHRLGRNHPLAFRVSTQRRHGSGRHQHRHRRSGTVSAARGTARGS
jgi:hypothetical protein